MEWLASDGALQAQQVRFIVRWLLREETPAAYSRRLLQHQGWLLAGADPSHQPQLPITFRPSSGACEADEPRGQPMDGSALIMASLIAYRAQLAFLTGVQPEDVFAPPLKVTGEETGTFLCHIKNIFKIIITIYIIMDHVNFPKQWPQCCCLAECRRRWRRRCWSTSGRSGSRSSCW